MMIQSFFNSIMNPSFQFNFTSQFPTRLSTQLKFPFPLSPQHQFHTLRYFQYSSEISARNVSGFNVSIFSAKTALKLFWVRTETSKVQSTSLLRMNSKKLSTTFFVLLQTLIHYVTRKFSETRSFRTPLSIKNH